MVPRPTRNAVLMAVDIMKIYSKTTISARVNAGVIVRGRKSWPREGHASRAGNGSEVHA